MPLRALLLSTILALVAGAFPVARAVAGPAQRPNFLVILTDDQRLDSLAFMPQTQARIGGQGVTFTNGFATTPLCNPSRASLLTGKYAHTHGAQRNESPLHGSTVFNALQAAGYQTGFTGKYMNSWNGTPRPEFDFWAVSEPGEVSFTDPTFNVNGTWTQRTGYHTYLVGDYALDFIGDVSTNAPFALMVGFRAPHSPATPAPGDEGLYANLPPSRPPNHNEADVSDKPAYLQATPPLSAATIAATDDFHRKQLQSLHSVDLAIASMLDALQARGMLDGTVVVFMSDNGRLNGEHRISQKTFLYEESARVPLLVRYPPLAPGARTESRFALNIDVAPTIYELAGLPAPLDVDGRSLVPLLANAPGPWREDFGLESWRNDGEAPLQLDAVRTAGHVYIENRDDTSELYDLAADPYQLQNVIASPAHATTLADMRARLARLRAAHPVDDSALSIAYDGWTGAEAPGASGGGYRRASAAGQTLRFRTAAPGTAVTLVSYRGPDQGMVRILVDGVERGTLDLYAASPQFQHPIAVSGLSNALHTITVVVTGTRNALSTGNEVRVDAFLYNAVLVEETHPGIAFNTWLSTTTAFALNSGYHSSGDPAASVRFTVSGTSFTWISARGTFFGIAGVTVDGVTSTVDLYAAVDEPRYPVTVGGLSPGIHQVEIRPTGTRNPAARNSMVVFDGVMRPPRGGNDTAGAYAPSTATFFLRDGTGAGTANLVFTFGSAGGVRTPIAGDWDGNGTATVGLYDPATGKFFLKNSNGSGAADVDFGFGAGGAGYVPLVGDWNGDGVETVGVYDPATGKFFLRNANAPGVADVSFRFGSGGPDVVPLAGDWNGDGVDTAGLYNRATGKFFLRNTNTPGTADVTFSFGGANRTPVTGDWNADRIDTIGVYDAATKTWFLRDSNTSGTADATFTYGPAGVTPLAGNWDGF